MTPRLMLTAAASGSGKTLITCGILKTLNDMGKQVTSFKCGPDYIDPMFHTKVLATKSRNLDSFFTAADTVRYLLKRNTKDSDIAVIEGVMGYYDGLAGISIKGSAYDVADITKTPVVFIVNCKGMSVSLIPYIKGFLEYQKESHIKGVILNNISPMLYERIKEQIEKELPIQVVGYVPELKDCILESRHLGLVMPDEITDIQEKLQTLSEILIKTLEFDKIIKIAQTAPVLTSSYQEPQPLFEGKEKVRIGLAKDEAFCFFYEDNLQLLKQLGAELVEFSPLHDSGLPDDLDGLILNGGYPELYAQKLSANQTMRASIAKALNNGLVCTAECGGFMYLHETMEDIKGQSYAMVGYIKGQAYKTAKLGRFGYITLKEGTIFGEPITGIPAHEFHYFDSTNCGEAMIAQKPLSNRKWTCMHSSTHLLAGFPHLYYYGNPKVAEAFLRKCKAQRHRNKA